MLSAFFQDSCEHLVVTLRNVAQKPAVIVLRFVFRAALHKDRGDQLDTDVNVLTKHETLMISGKMDPVIDPDLVVNKWKLRRMSPTAHANYTLNPVLQRLSPSHQTSLLWL